jgi:nucleoside-diphosphate-sugar epimerase
MKILILGGTRYIGYKTASILSGLGNEVVTLSRSHIQKNKWKHLVCDRKIYSDLEFIFKTEKPDLVLDMICFDKNDAIGITRLHDLRLLNNVSHYLMVSTFFLYNYCDSRECKFTGNIETITDAYTKRKAEAESVLVSSFFFNKTSIVRLPYVFSKDDYTGRFQKLCKLSMLNSKTTSIDLFKTSMISMVDASVSLANIILGSPLGFVDVSNRGCMNLGDIQNVIRNCNGLNDSKPSIDVINGPYPLYKSLCLNSKKWIVSRTMKEALLSELTD